MYCSSVGGGAHSATGCVYCHIYQLFCFVLATNSLGVQQASHGKSTKDRSNLLMPLTLIVMLSNLGGIILGECRAFWESMSKFD